MKKSRTLSMISMAALGAILGCAAMFAFDPVSGRRRRSLARDKVVGLKNDVANFGEKKARHFTNRAKGLASQAGLDKVLH